MFRVLAALLALALPATAAEFRTYEGHGGPVTGIAIDGDRLLTAGFDYAVGLWPLGGGAPVWLEGHRAAVNDVAFARDDRAISGGDDFAVILWDLATGQPLRRMEGHDGRVAGVAMHPDGTRAASAGWDGRVIVWDLATGAGQEVATGHRGPVADVAWDAEGTLWTAGQDGTLRAHTDDAPPRVMASHGFGINRLATGPGWVAYGATDGGTRVIDAATGATLADLTAGRRPVLALSHANGQLAIGDGQGYVMVVETEGWRVLRDFRAAARGPVWALALTEGAVVSGGLEAEARQWPLDGEVPVLATGTLPEGATNGERQFQRACSVCHTLGTEWARRAGPPLGGLFGRKAGSVAGYPYSAAMQGSDIVWTEATVDALFDVGPDHYVPGSKMPMQRVGDADDRADLVAYLRQATSPAPDAESR